MASLTESSIVFIGGGVMAEALIRGILAKGLAGPGRITVSEPLPSRREYLTANLGVRAIDDNAAAARLADVIVLAVKPQAAAAALAPISGPLAEVDARLMVALTRGLLLDLAATGDVAGVVCVVFIFFFFKQKTAYEI